MIPRRILVGLAVTAAVLVGQATGLWAALADPNALDARPAAVTEPEPTTTIDPLVATQPDDQLMSDHRGCGLVVVDYHP